MLGSIYVEGRKVDEPNTLKWLNNFELLLYSLRFNETKVIMDVEHEDDVDRRYSDYND
jgi:hypothetical protein